MCILFRFMVEHALTLELICRAGDALDCTRREEDKTDNASSRTRCLPRTPILSSFLHPKGDSSFKSPVSDCRRSSSARQDCDEVASGNGSKRFADASVTSATTRADSFRKEEKLVKIEES